MTVALDPSYLEKISKGYDPAEIESRWYQEWEKRGYFSGGQHVLNHSPVSPYVIQLPPPNVTGTLHMGHAFNQTIMDGLTRYHRMTGHDTVFIPGTDHAGIATQIVVERQLDAQKISRHDLGREKFIEKVWEWKSQSGHTITQQMRRLGTSSDWQRAYFTMDDGMSGGVVETFVRLYQQGLIYRGKRLVNWDPKLMTAVSDLEVQSEEVQGHLWYILYPFVNGSQLITDKNHQPITLTGLTIATTRPETLLGDSAICVHPEDQRYQHLVGQQVTLPLCDRTIPIIADTFVDPAFGTGCVKITGAHDFNDYACAQRHDLPLINIFTFDAHINENAPEAFRGLEREAARLAVIEALKKHHYLIKIEPHLMMQPRGDRTGAVLEPMLTDQWFVAMSQPAAANTLHPHQSIASVALKAVANGQIRFHPENWTAIYNQWLNNIQDWCISRQLWWGHQIPAWYTPDGQIFVARCEAEAIAQARAAGITESLTRDSDVLDTWFSSALVPFTTLGWPNDTVDLSRYFPSSVLVTGFDIIFFWVARMVMMSLHLTGQIPFKDVYVHGLIRDADGQKMSKSKGNTLDPVDLIDGIELERLIAKRCQNLMNPTQAKAIEKTTRQQYPKGINALGADALRFTMAAYASLGRNINFDLKRCEGYRNFCNKLWNATRFVLMNVQGQPIAIEASYCLSFADRWIVSALQKSISEVERGFAEYRFDQIAQTLYRFIWDEFCDWYLEFAKVQLQKGAPLQQQATRHVLMQVLETVLRLAHPIMPFITEELWQNVSLVAGLRQAEDKTSISIQAYPHLNSSKIDPIAVSEVEELKAQIDAIRALRSEMGITASQKIPLFVVGNHTRLTRNADYLVALAKLSNVEVVKALPKVGAPVQVVGSTRLMLKVDMDVKIEQARLNKEMTRLQTDIVRVNIKLSNTKFMARAPLEVVEQEKKRLHQLNATLEMLRDQHEKLNLT